MSIKNIFFLKILNNSLSNLKYVYKLSLMKEIQYLFNLFNNKKVITIVFLNNYTERNSILGQALHKWVRAVTIHDTIYILEFNKKFYINNIEFERILIHEIIHVLIYIKVNSIDLWLNEGLAIILSKQYKYMKFDQFIDLNMNNLSYNTDFFYEKCCARTMKYFNKYGEKQLIKKLISGELDIKNDC